MRNILQEIFLDHYEEIIYTMHPRPVEVENIFKMINCGDPAFGGAMYGCPKCGRHHFVPFRCHSRFCPTCGNLYARKRAEAMAGVLINCKHRHCVFTIPEELRHYFKEDRSLLDSLFEAVRQVILHLFYKMNHAMNFTPGFILVLHTFGRPLEWNPHIHCLLSEGGVADDGTWRHVTHFNYAYLRNSFRTVLLNLMEKRLGPSFKQTKGKMYRLHDKGFYVYAKPTLADVKTLSEYIGRYLGRPVIATKRIDKYDAGAGTVTFHYNRHEDNKYIEKTVPVLEFISLLMQHIPEKHFKMIRYYGVYARHRAIDRKIRRMRSKEQHRFFQSFHKWRNSIFLNFGYDPLKCPGCGTTMLFLDLYFNCQRVSLEDLYERTMLSFKAGKWRSTAS